MARWDEKVNLLEFLRNFSKFYENFLKKIAKNTWVYRIFKRFNELCGNFSPVWTKMQIVGNFSKNLSNIFLGKLLKTHYFSMFSKNFINHAFVFRAFGRKTQFVGKFWEIFENFPNKIAKNALFLHIFQKI